MQLTVCGITLFSLKYVCLAKIFFIVIIGSRVYFLYERNKVVKWMFISMLLLGAGISLVRFSTRYQSHQAKKKSFEVDR